MIISCVIFLHEEKIAVSFISSSLLLHTCNIPLPYSSRLLIHQFSVFYSSMHLLLLLSLISSVNGVGNDTAPTSSPSSMSNNEQQLQLTDVSAICDPAIAAITAWLVLVIVSLFRYRTDMCIYHVYTRQNDTYHTIICAHIMCSHFLFYTLLMVSWLLISHIVCSPHH